MKKKENREIDNFKIKRTFTKEELAGAQEIIDVR